MFIIKENNYLQKKGRKLLKAIKKIYLDFIYVNLIL